MKTPLGRQTTMALELLFPEGGSLKERAQQAVELAHDLRRESEDEISVESVCLEFDQEARTRAGGAIEDLLVHHLRAIYAGGSFMCLPPARSRVQAAWDILAVRRDTTTALPGVPEPGESSLAVAARLLDGLYLLNWDNDELEVWRARLEHVSAGARAGEHAYRERLANTPSSGDGSRTHADLQCGLVASLLDRGAVGEAGRALEQSVVIEGKRRDSRLQRLRMWVALFAGDLSGAKTDQESLTGDGVDEPRALLELREAWPAARPYVEAADLNHFRESSWDPVQRSGALRARGEIGATVLAIFAFGSGHCLEALHVDADPALRSRLYGWLRKRGRACLDRCHPEHALVIEARPRRVHGRELASALSPQSVALVLTPLLDDDGEVVGWVHLEWEHHLVPDASRLRNIAMSWQLPVLRRAGDIEGRLLETSDRVNESGRPNGGWQVPDARARIAERVREPTLSLSSAAFRDLIGALGSRMSQRRWWAFIHQCGVTSFVVSAGEGLGNATDAPGAARGLDRCLATMGVVQFFEPDPRLSIHALSSSGVVIPLVRADCVIGFLAIESIKRRDFSAPEVERLSSLTAQFALSIQLSLFRSWHLEAFGFDLHFDATSPMFQRFAADVATAAQSKAPLVLSGPGGSGKHVVARWIQWSSGRAEEGLDSLNCASASLLPESRGEFAARLRRPGGFLFLEHLESLPGTHQEELLLYLDGEGLRSAEEKAEAGALIVTIQYSLADCAERGDLLPDLAARLDRIQLFMPALRDRRCEIPGLVYHFAKRFAREELRAVPHFDRDAIALLWRQEWKGNLRELEALVYKMVVLCPDSEIGVAELQEIARRFKLCLDSRLPSRRPRRSDVVQALRSTLKKTGTFNKRRASIHLGWDPDTLTARIAEMDINESNLEQEPDSWIA
ncbi:MAG: hypothetical protein ACI8X5_002443 [Planctomycetota bacterium]|jgi:hypothetical protein